LLLITILIALRLLSLLILFVGELKISLKSRQTAAHAIQTSLSCDAVFASPRKISSERMLGLCNESFIAFERQRLELNASNANYLISLPESTTTKWQNKHM